MSGEDALFIAFFLLCAGGAAVSFVVPKRSRPLALAALGTVSAALVLTAGVRLLVGNTTFHAELWPLLSLGVLTLAADRLTGLFLVVSGLVFLPVSIFSGVYLGKYLAHRNLRSFSVLYHGLCASIVLVLLADDVLSFLIAWELMSIASYLLVNYEYERPGSAQAGFVMLAMSEAGTIAVLIAFVLVAVAAGSSDFAQWRSVAPSLNSGLAWAVFLLSFFGFGVKAGLVPVNSWLPLAHPVAPTNVSALLSTAIVNLGIYGILRVNVDLLPVAGVGPGVVMLLTGSVSALVGILYATTQAEMKRLLAHSTIENMGIIAAGIGAAAIFLTGGYHAVGAIALVAALYHLANHSVYKALLFIGTGAVEAGAGSRDLDRLGGIIRHMPWTSALFLVGVLAISALPPLNGFVSEWLTLQTLLRATLLKSTAVKIVFAISGALLALTAGLAVTCFVKVFAMGFLGMSRSEGAAQAKEAPRGSRLALTVLAAACIALGVLPTYVVPVLDGVVMPFAHESATTALIPPFFSPEAQRKEAIPPAFVAEFHDLGAQVGEGVLPGRGLVILHRGEDRNPVVFAMSTSYAALMLVVILAVVFLVFRLATRHRALARGPAWDGGLRWFRSNMTYTATGFSNPVRVVFRAIISPVTAEDSTEDVSRHFRTAIRREEAELHVVDRLALQPPVNALRWISGIVRKMHVGHVNAYSAYVLIVLLLVLVAGAGLR